MPSHRHQALARLIPLVKRSRELDTAEAERARIEASHRGLQPRLPTALVPRFSSRWSVETEDLGFASYVLTPRRRDAARTIYYTHGGGYAVPIDPLHVRYAVRLADAIGARLVMPDYPLAPEHTWKDSHDALVEDVARKAEAPGGVALVGDSAGGGMALALARSMRDRGLTPATHLVLHSPWVDLTTSAPGTDEFDRVDPWLFIGKVRVWAEWWAGSPEDLGRPEVSPGLGDLSGLPPALMLQGTRDLLAPASRLLATRAAEAGWDLTYVEEPDLLHVYPLLPFVPEAGRAFGQVVEFLR